MAAGDPGVLKRNFSATAIETTLSSPISSAATGDTTTSVAVVSVSGFPSTLPYTLIIGADTSKEEVVTVTAASSTILTITRGQDNTQAVSHAAGASVRHGISARDFKESQTHISARGYDADSGILANASQTHVHGLVSGDGAIVGSTQAVTLTRKTLGTGTTIASTVDMSSGTISGGTLTSPTISGSPVITGLSSAGMSSSSAAPKSYVDALITTNAAYATAAANSAATAATSAASAATYATTAQNWATQLSTPVSGSDYSAKYNANLAAASAASAATSANTAITSASSAAASAASAAVSASSAAASVTSAVQLSTITTKGDLIAGTGSATVARLGAGTNGYILSADSTQTTGLAWIAANPGDITSVTAGTGLSGGGTSGDVTVSLNTSSVYVVPSQTSNTGKALTTDGTTSSWSTTINGTAIPSTKTLVVTTDKLSVHAATTSAELAGIISDETGSGALVFGTSPTIANPTVTGTLTAGGSAGTSGYVLSTTGTGIQWIVAPSGLPSQTSNAGKYLTTDGTSASWATVTTDPTADIFMMMGA